MTFGPTIPTCVSMGSSNGSTRSRLAPSTRDAVGRANRVWSAAIAAGGVSFPRCQDLRAVLRTRRSRPTRAILPRGQPPVEVSRRPPVSRPQSPRVGVAVGPERRDPQSEHVPLTRRLRFQQRETLGSGLAVESASGPRLSSADGPVSGWVETKDRCSARCP